MGGPGSGRIGRRICEHRLPKLNINEMRRRGFFGDQVAGASVGWVSFPWVELELRHTGDRIAVVTTGQLLDIEVRRTPTGGLYRYFRCGCGALREALYVDPRDLGLHCRGCFQLTYEIRNASRNPLREACARVKSLRRRREHPIGGHKAHDARLAVAEEVKAARVHEFALILRERVWGHIECLPVPFLEATPEQLRRVVLGPDA